MRLATVAPQPRPPSPDFAGMAAKAREAAGFLKALAHESRLMILCLLCEGEKSVTELEHMLALRQPTVSQQLARLRTDGLVSTRRNGKTIYYRLASEETRVIIEAKITGDDGTARDKVTRILRLAAMRDERLRAGRPSFDVVACVDGRGFGVRRNDMKANADCNPWQGLLVGNPRSARRLYDSEEILAAWKLMSSTSGLYAGG